MSTPPQTRSFQTAHPAGPAHKAPTTLASSPAPSLLPDGHIHRLFDLTGKTFLVAGGAHNLGRDMATALAEAGADGAVTSRDADAATHTAAEIAAATGRSIVGLGLDATAETGVSECVNQVVAQMGGIDILVLSVGGGGGGAAGAPMALEERPLEAWEALHATNVTAPFLLCKHVAPVMERQGNGSIIHIASIAGLVGRDRTVYPPGMPPQPVDYASAKAAVLGMMRDMAAYLGPHGIRVNAISPGGFERGQPPAFVEAYSRRCVLGRMGRDGVDLKGAVVFLAADASAYITGHNLVVDGGFTIWQ